MIINVYFKVIFTTNTKYYNINTLWTPCEMYEKLKYLIKRDFKIENFELVDTVPLINYTGQSENKPKLELLNNITIDEIYENKINNISFYIRPI
jgi:hypothetical protein